MDAQEIINFIATAPKTTPVKVYVREAEGASVSYGEAKVFGGPEGRVVFGDWAELEGILAEASASGAIADYVVENDGRIDGVFALIFGEDPTYRMIEGNWLDDSPYGTIHRVASAEGAHGIFAAALAFALEKSKHLRIDTHRDNLPMQHLILKHGFQYCGVIYVADGSPRFAYERVEEK